jgi:hypothetical protein
VDAPTADRRIVLHVNLTIKRVTNRLKSHLAASLPHLKSLKSQRFVPNASSLWPIFMLTANANANVPCARAAGSVRTLK